MELRLKIKPSVNKGRTREEALKYITQQGYHSYHSDSYYNVSFDRTSALLYNLVKHKKKTKQNRWKTNGKDPRVGKYKNSEILYKKEWTAYVYKIPIEVIKLLEVEIIQNSRNFTIKSKK